MKMEFPSQEGILNEGPLYTTSIQNALLSDDELGNACTYSYRERP